MKKLLLAVLLVCPPALAAGPGANCPVAVYTSSQIDAGVNNIVDSGVVFCDGGNFCDGGVPLYINSTQSYFQVVCNLNNPTVLNADPVQPDLYFATQGSYDGGKFNDGTIYSIPVDGGVLKKLSPSTEACPVSLTSDGVNVIWVNAGTNCNFLDGGGVGQNALLDAPWDGGTNVVLVAGYQGIHNVVSDGTSAYFSVDNQTGNNPEIGTLQSVLLDAGASYPVTTLWSSASGTGMVNGQLCTWANGLMSCPALGVTNQPLFNKVGSLAVNNGTIYWGPSGMSMPTNGSAIPVVYGAQFPGPEEKLGTLDAGVFWMSGSGILNGSNQSLAVNADNHYQARATDQTTVFYSCNPQTNGGVSVCSVPVYQTTSYPVQVAGEFVAGPGSSNTAFSYTASAPAVYNSTFTLSFNAATGNYPFASDNDAGLITAVSNTNPSVLPKILDGGIVYSTGSVFMNLSAALPPGYNILAQYTGTTTVKNVPNITQLATGLPGISGMVVDTLGNLDWVSPVGIDSGYIMMMQPK